MSVRCVSWQEDIGLGSEKIVWRTHGRLGKAEYLYLTCCVIVDQDA